MGVNSFTLDLQLQHPNGHYDTDVSNNYALVLEIYNNLLHAN